MGDTEPIHGIKTDEADKVLQQQRKEIQESLQYASSIQSALLSDPRQLDRFFTDHFVFLRPRDLVSGDFYWFHADEDRIVVVAADCTGHGVPGAFMSILGMSFLNEIARNTNIHACQILNRLRERVMKALRQTGDFDEHKEGMDMSLIVYERSQQMVEFSGANNPLYLVRQGEVLVYKGDTMPIGVNIVEENTFNVHRIAVRKKDILYLFSDGFPDQFGGPNQKKFKYRRFRKLLLNLAQYPMELQRKKIEEEFLRWKGDIPQIDDILVMGLLI